VEALVDQMLLIELRQVGHQFAGRFEIVVNIAIDERDALLGLSGPARCGYGRGSWSAHVILLAVFSIESCELTKLSNPTNIVNQRRRDKAF
jgi:hypothetical protein